ncbi:MFS transporter [Sphingosinicella soli]|uniref:Acyl-[acyl-carrier-protein]-phospholipid O-acyltransferase/long-chain-fatty-acid--[acyl-carrier-protein] ligase n=1 Tax=Sphingosinicella soli TaxID=333708 RepID=A0A7W7F4Y9_9SPHN|nr:MFS transporter [Sphingosinicella soli]MBB4630845.1 acyl-[acyl-carrier-protein]-phospholipid O-acyltransferase/long-chain-fatty-acid--[acyl-carrier-protein] ligase [Sphingosinicella soli]
MTQAVNSFNDNLYRTAMLFVIAFEILPGNAAMAGTWAVVAGGLSVLPYFVFSSLAGELAERMDKARLAQILRAVDVGLMMFAAVAIMLSSLPLMLAAVFGTGMRAVFFGPLKYSILPQHLDERELLAGTGLMQAASFLATVSGQVAAALLPNAATAVILVLLAIGAFLAACAIPPAPPVHPDLPMRRNLAAGMIDLVRSAMEDRVLLGAILGISWFYALGAGFTSQFPSLVANVVGATETVGAIFLAAFTLGLAAGAIGVSNLLKGRVSARYVPFSAAFLSLFTFDLWLVTSGLPAPSRLVGASEFLTDGNSWRILFDLFGISLAAGAFAVPLFAVLQTVGDPERRARSVAANNLANAAAVVLVALLAGFLFAVGGSIPTFFLMLAMTTLAVATIAWRNSARIRLNRAS